MRSRTGLLALALLVLAACSADPTAPTTATDTVTVSPQIERVQFHGYVTTLPDRRYCRYVAPIPADTLRRHWVCYVWVVSDSLFNR